MAVNPPYLEQSTNACEKYDSARASGKAADWRLTQNTCEGMRDITMGDMPPMVQQVPLTV